MTKRKRIVPSASSPAGVPRGISGREAGAAAVRTAHHHKGEDPSPASGPLAPANPLPPDVHRAGRHDPATAILAIIRRSLWRPVTFFDVLALTWALGMWIAVSDDRFRELMWRQWPW